MGCCYPRTLLWYLYNLFSKKKHERKKVIFHQQHQSKNFHNVQPYQYVLVLQDENDVVNPKEHDDDVSDNTDDEHLYMMNRYVYDDYMSHVF